jgi:catechol 2,3-dioxygenase-like lactoylglutathione lyase family enzyme
MLRRVLETLDHVVIATRDLAPAAARTSRLLSRGPSWSGEHPALGTANALFRLENSYLELLAPAGPGALAAALEGRLAGAGEGLFALAFGTRDAEACRAALAARGLEPGPVAPGVGHDVESGAWREWRNIVLPPARTRGVPLFAIEHRSPPELLPLVAPLGAPAAAPHALDHVVVRSADADASRALYGDGLGLRLALDRRFEAFGFRGLFFRVGGVTIEVAGPLAAAPDPAAADVLSGLAFSVGDVEAAQRRLAALEFDVSPVRAGRKPGTLVCTVRDAPCGVPTLLVGPAPGAAVA